MIISMLSGLNRTDVANYNALSAASPDPITQGDPNYDEIHYINVSLSNQPQNAICTDQLKPAGSCSGSHVCWVPRHIHRRPRPLRSAEPPPTMG